MTLQERLEKQAAAHKVGADTLKTLASDLGLALTKGGKGKAGGKADGVAVALGGDGWIGQIHIE